MSIVQMDSKARVFNPYQASVYLESLRKNQNLMTLVHCNHQFDWTKSEGLQRDELKRLASRCRDSELRELYELALETLKDNNQSTLLASNGDSNHASASNLLRKSHVLYAEKENDKYNIIAANTVQTKEIDWEKVTAAGFTSSLVSAGLGIGIGALLGSTIGFAGTFIGGVVGGSVGGLVGASGVASKVYHDYSQGMPEAVYAYIFQELQEKQVLCIDDNRFTLRRN